MTESNGSAKQWQFIAGILASLIIGFMASYLTSPHDTLTRADLAQALVPVQRQIDDLARQNGENKAAIEQLDVDVARISEHLGVSARPTVSH